MISLNIDLCQLICKMFSILDCVLEENIDYLGWHIPKGDAESLDYVECAKRCGKFYSSI